MHVYGWFSRGIRTIPISISMLSRPMANTPGTVNTVLKNSGALDMDVTTGYGPEIFAMPAPVHGRYQVYINYYGGRSETELTTAQLTLITDEGSVNEKQETFIVPMRNAGELTLVKSFDW